jgi:predicted nucleic acid-binding protein
MIVIADSSPLRYLILIGRVELLASLFEHVIAPPGVVKELSHPSSPAPVRTWSASTPSWLTVRSPRGHDSSLSINLGLGESEAIALAEETQADALLTDDRAARREAEGRGIRVQGTLGILDLAAQIGLIDFPSAIEQLRSTTFAPAGSSFNSSSTGMASVEPAASQSSRSIRYTQSQS